MIKEALKEEHMRKIGICCTEKQGKGLCGEIFLFYFFWGGGCVQHKSKYHNEI